MSIIRFRTAVKDTQDIVFIFFSLAIGLAAGVGMYALSLGSTIVIGLVILITDGVEQCEDDPCAIARSIKRAKPWVAAHVVKLGPESSSACVAEALGGKVYQPSSADELAQVVAEARITAPFALGCRR